MTKLQSIELKENRPVNFGTFLQERAVFVFSQVKTNGLPFKSHVLLQCKPNVSPQHLLSDSGCTAAELTVGHRRPPAMQFGL